MNTVEKLKLQRERTLRKIKRHVDINSSLYDRLEIIDFEIEKWGDSA